MKRIPYGDSNFEKIVRDGSFFVDKTSFLAMLEQAGSNLVYLRPRRFGKSLWVSIMQYYYGLEHEAKFAELFGHLAIGQNPTALANKCLVLKFDFSGISTDSDSNTLVGFHKKIQGSVGNFLSAYQQFFSPAQRKAILKENSPAELMTTLFNTCLQNRIPHPIYILVDEYDHFANELIAFRLTHFKDMVGRNGFVHKFYETIKTATQEGVVGRVFITGVSPITLDSLTSGFNITSSLTNAVPFHDMMGFTNEQTADALRNAGAHEEQLPAMLQDMAQWYNGYRFHPEAPERVYNTDMVLYFTKQYAETGKYPDDMLDSNIASDYGKIRETFRIAKQETLHQVILQEVLLDGYTSTKLTRQFSFEVEFTAENLKSLLFYLGHLTVDRAVGADWFLKIPNQVIRDLFWGYYGQLNREQTNLAVHTDDVKMALNKLVHHNAPQELVGLVAKTLASLSNRDSQNFDEKHLKAIMASYLVLSNSYLMRSEFEAERKYVDILLLKRPPFAMPHQFAFELKYLKKNATQASIEAKAAEAKAQIQTYRDSAELDALENLRAWVIVIAGTAVKVLREV